MSNQRHHSKAKGVIPVMKPLVNALKQLDPNTTLLEAMPTIHAITNSTSKNKRYPVITDPKNPEKILAIYCNFYEVYLCYLDKNGKEVFSKQNTEYGFRSYSKQGGIDYAKIVMKFKDLRKQRLLEAQIKQMDFKAGQEYVDELKPLRARAILECEVPDHYIKYQPEKQ